METFMKRNGELVQGTRNVEHFDLGCSPTSGGAQVLTVVAFNGVFDHSVYTVVYSNPEDNHVDVNCPCYQSPQGVADEVREMCRGPWVEAALERVGCNFSHD